MADSGGNGGTGFASLLTLLFIGLKLMGYIQWSWVWVLAPTWIVFLLAFILTFVLKLLESDRKMAGNTK